MEHGNVYGVSSLFFLSSTKKLPEETTHGHVLAYVCAYKFVAVYGANDCYIR